MKRSRESLRHGSERERGKEGEFAVKMGVKGESGGKERGGSMR